NLGDINFTGSPQPTMHSLAEIAALLYQSGGGAASWSGWSGRNGDGTLAMVARGSDNRIYENQQGCPGCLSSSWQGWTALSAWAPSETEKTFVGTPSLARNADWKLEVFARASDNTIAFDEQLIPGGAWSGWTTLPTNVASFGGDPTVAPNVDGRLEV